MNERAAKGERSGSSIIRIKSERRKKESERQGLSSSLVGKTNGGASSARSFITAELVRKHAPVKRARSRCASAGQRGWRLVGSGGGDGREGLERRFE
jgi:hypothetical protein